MATILDKIIIENNGTLRILEKENRYDLDGNLQAVSSVSRTILPGTNLSQEHPRIKAIAEVAHSSAFLETPIKSTLLPNWTGFNTEMLADTGFISVFVAASGVNPILGPSLPAVLTQVINNDIEMFTVIWNSIVTLGGATAEQKERWGAIARKYNLPTKFVQILIG